MGLDDIPIRDPEARRLAELDVAALKAAEPPSFRLDRALLRLDVAVKNGLGEREALRLEQLAQSSPPLSRWQRKLKNAWSATRARMAVGGAVAALAAGTLVWASVDKIGVDADSDHATKELSAMGQTHRYQLEDGSTIELRDGAQGQLSTTDEAVDFELMRGVVDFDVMPRRGRTWRVTAKDYEVVVVGTRFTVSYDPPENFSVQVERGAVAVRVPAQQTPFQLAAGSSLSATRGEVTLHHNVPRAPTASVEDLEPIHGEVSVAQRQPGQPGATMPEASEQGDSEAVAGSRRTAKVGVQSSAARELPSEAAELRLLRRARKAITDGDHRGALSWIAKHKAKFPKGQLVEEREALRVEALRGLGRDKEARQAAGEFRQRFPKSVLSPQMPGNER